MTGGPQTENSGPPFLGLVCSRLNRKPTKGFIQRSEGGPPKTDFIPSHRSLRSQVGFSLFSLSISWKQKEEQVGGSTRKPPDKAGLSRVVKTGGKATQLHCPTVFEDGVFRCSVGSPSAHQPPQPPRAQPGCSRLARLTSDSWHSGPGAAFHSFATNIYQVSALGLQFKGVKAINF